jgi:hypothetical protein
LSVTASTPLDDGADVAGGVSREPQANETATPRSMEKNFMEYLERRRQVPTPRAPSKERAAVVRTRGRVCAAFDAVEAGGALSEIRRPAATCGGSGLVHPWGR